MDTPMDNGFEDRLKKAITTAEDNVTAEVDLRQRFFDEWLEIRNKTVQPALERAAEVLKRFHPKCHAKPNGCTITLHVSDSECLRFEPDRVQQQIKITASYDGVEGSSWVVPNEGVHEKCIETTLLHFGQRVADSRAARNNKIDPLMR
jgi:hypothetical protein